MKVQIRQGVFETNSSSVHSISICSKDEWRAFERGELMIHPYNNEFLPTDEALKENEKTIKRNQERGWDVDSSTLYMTCDEYNEHRSYYEMFQHEKNINGVDVIAFGYYGNDY